MSKWHAWPKEFTLSTKGTFSSQFPSLHPRFCDGDVSPATSSYNCIAWAAGETAAWWEPHPDYYWPEGVSLDYTLPAYIAAFQTRGFDICANGSLEPGVEKIVLYEINGYPTHAARQLANGNWTSKLGHFEDIQHTDLGCLEGPLYGSARIYMKRKLPQ
jgi:hypothetical protein